MGLETRFFSSNDLGLLVTNNSQIFPSIGTKMDGQESMDGESQGENDHLNDKWMMENVLSSYFLYVCSQLDMYHVGNYMGSTWWYAPPT